MLRLRLSLITELRLISGKIKLEVVLLRILPVSGGIFFAALLLFIVEGTEGNLLALNVNLTSISEDARKERLLEKISVWLLSCDPDEIPHRSIN